MASPIPVPAPRVMTYEDYRALPNDGKRYELIDGELFVTPSASWMHHGIAGNLYGPLRAYLADHPLGCAYIGGVDVVWTPPRRVKGWVVPDLIYIAREHLHIRGEVAIHGAPDLIVEVLSPGKENMERDLIKKRRLYQRHGVKEYWVAFQDIVRVEVYRLGPDGKYGKPEILEAGDVLTTPLLPGFSLLVERLYQDLPPA